MSHTSIEIYYRTMSELKMIGWSIAEQENQYPFERDIHHGFIQMDIAARNSGDGGGGNTGNPPPDFFV